MTRFLAIETSTPRTQIALFESTEAKKELILSLDSIGRHVESLVPTIDMAMKIAGWSQGSLNALALSVGPGAWSGLRTGFATAQGIAEGLKIPIVGIPTLEIVAHNAPAQKGQGSTRVVTSRAFGNDVFLQVWNDGQDGALVASGEAIAVGLATWLESQPGEAKATVFGTGVDARWSSSQHPNFERGPASWDLPKVQVLAELAALRFEDEQEAAFLAADATPLYVKNPDIALPKGKAS